MEFLSNCCSGGINNDNDLCQSCGEHCGAVDELDNEYEFQINRWVQVGVGSMEEKINHEVEEKNI